VLRCLESADGRAAQVRQRDLFLRCHLYIKVTISPRQARDKRREKHSKKTVVFLYCSGWNARAVRSKQKHTIRAASLA
jgi:hypothetical protein